MDGYFYINSKTENCNENHYIKSLKEQISVLKAQISILREDNKRLINKIEKLEEE